MNRISALIKEAWEDFHGSSVDKNLPASIRDIGSIPVPERLHMPQSMHHNYWNCALEPGSCDCWAHVPLTTEVWSLGPAFCNKRYHQIRSLHTITKSSPPLATTKESLHAAKVKLFKKKQKNTKRPEKSSLPPSAMWGPQRKDANEEMDHHQTPNRPVC